MMPFTLFVVLVFACIGLYHVGRCIWKSARPANYFAVRLPTAEERNGSASVRLRARAWPLLHELAEG